ncbi:hypothetical protein KY284_037272 [Solanum tuberosum]|nr:hypothetical protein KY284_037272 [Solanum tuberosum]
MYNSITLTILIDVGPILRGENVETLFSLTTVKLVNPLGAVLGWTILLLQHDRVPSGPYLYGMFMSLVFHSFSILMLIRPTNTDLGLMYSLCALSIGISARDDKYRAVIDAAAAAKSVNDNVEIVDRKGVDNAIEEASRDGEVVVDRVEAVEGVDDAIEEAGRVDSEVVVDRAEAIDSFDAIKKVV